MKIDQIPTPKALIRGDAAYQTLEFVSHPSHLEQIKNDPSSLVVSCDWLLVQEALAQGIDCVAIDSCATDGAVSEDNSEIYLRTVDWIYENDIDVTLFHSVSLGRKFSRDFSILVVEFMRIQSYVTSLIAFYKPKQIVFHGCELEMSALDREGSLNLVQSIAAKSGISVIKRDEADEHATLVPRYCVHTPAASSSKNKFRWKDFVLGVMGKCLVTMSFIQHAVFFWRPTVLMLTSQLTLNPLLNIRSSFLLRPIVLFDWLPGKKAIGKLLHRLSKGMLVSKQYDEELSAEDLAQIQSIEKRILTIENTSNDEPRAKEIFRYVHRHILEKREFYKLAQKVKEAEKLLDRWTPDAIFTDSLQNRLILILLELADIRGIPRASTWHSFYLIDTKIPLLGGDKRAHALCGKVLTWGHVHEKWLGAIGSNIEFSRTGNVISNQHNSSRPSRDEWENILVLQYVTPYNDIHISNSNEFEYFIQISKMLKNKKFRMRLHPGTSKTEYYKKIRDYFNINCVFDDSGPFESCLDWADVGIGPIQSGATLECISYGLPYFPVLLSPNAVNLEYLKDVPVIQNITELEQAFNAGDTSDLKPFLESLSASAEISDSAVETWNQLHELTR